MSEQEKRRAAIARLVRERPIATQEDLRGALGRAGFTVTQATLSRDLHQLAARRVALPDGATAYELPDDAVPDPALEALRGLVDRVESNGALVVVKTRPGGASAIARFIDLARSPDVLGTIAGDDTIFVAPSRAHAAKALASRLRRSLSGSP